MFGRIRIFLIFCLIMAMFSILFLKYMSQQDRKELERIEIEIVKKVKEKKEKEAELTYLISPVRIQKILKQHPELFADMIKTTAIHILSPSQFRKVALEKQEKKTQFAGNNKIDIY
ncbi:MAG: hypothetical protein Ta2D_10830 [Rickettsiales bacterium]|nr:MAG: hypothetical protein Ta2D_10830 [Rickettsiales bacterium]